MNGVSIVVCCHNSAERLPATLAHLAAQEVSDAIPWEVIVVDNASTDQTAAVARELWPSDEHAPLRVVEEPMLGLSHARHRGFSEAHFEYVSFVDDDNWVAPDWVRTVFDVMSQHPDVGACGGVSDGVYEVEPPDWFHERAQSYAVGSQGKLGDVTDDRGYLWGAGLIVRLSAWNELVDNGFKQELTGRTGNALTSGEDTELCFALRLAGWRLRYDDRLHLKHLIPAARLQWHYCRKLLRTAGEASVVFDQYLFLLERPHLYTPNKNGKGWLTQWWLISRELLGNPLRILHVIRRPPDGDGLTIWLEWRIGRLIGLLRHRGDLDRILDSAYAFARRTERRSAVAEQRETGVLPSGVVR